MEYRSLGRTGLKVSHLCLGTMTFGNRYWGCDAATSSEIIQRYLDAGGNFVDAADIYARGQSEVITGRAIAGRRQQVILATKCASPMGPGPNDSGTSRKHILDAVDGSLRRLGTDYIDLYQTHFHDDTTPEQETLRALDDLVRAGKVRYVGCCNYYAWQLALADGLARELGTARYDSLQPMYSLISRDIEREHVPLCLARGIGIIPYSPLAGGLLTGKVRRHAPPPKGSRLGDDSLMRGAFVQDRNVEIAEAVIGVAEKLGHSPSQVALAWAAQQPGITSVIFGARTLAQLDDNLTAAGLRLEAETLAALDRASRPLPSYPQNFYALREAMRARYRFGEPEA
jgi:aryl-alcohol dehydrogenase-like predicted oxidoreductase